jgi:hypothetical protein
MRRHVAKLDWARQLVTTNLVLGAMVVSLSFSYAHPSTLHELNSPPAFSLNEPQDPSTKTTRAESPEQMRNTIKRLTSDVERLRRRVSELEKTCEVGTLRDRLTKEEQRAEDLQRQLVGVGEKEVGLQTRMDQVNEQLQPENLDQLQVYGSTRPEQIRETTRNRLNNEKMRLQSQLDQIQQSKTRLQSSLSASDMIIQRLRLQLQNVARP